MRPAGLYIHLPFCLQKCAYCDFCSYTGLEDHYVAYVNALLREAEAQAATWSDRSFDTVYIGGGTPTALPHDVLIDLWQELKQRLPIAADSPNEVTIEANPGTVDVRALTSLRVAGIQRLSIGVQSLNDHELALLGRIHGADQARQAVQMARVAGFDNVNLDLMFGLPGQQLSDWQQSLKEALWLAPEHLSLYCLTVEQGTPLAEQIASARLPAPDDDLAAEMYEWAQDLLCAAGYYHYEISNWARLTPEDERKGQGTAIIPAMACRHNLKYWRYEPYLGLGVASHSFDGSRRWANTDDVAEYIACWERNQSATAFCEEPSPEQQLGEAMMLGLRLIDGVFRCEMEARFGVNLMEVYGAEIQELVQQGLLLSDADGRIRLSRRGRLLGNRVFAAFLR
jgi:oxygen-independent coproporphyrinogen III oxidase